MTLADPENSRQECEAFRRVVPSIGFPKPLEVLDDDGLWGLRWEVENEKGTYSFQIVFEGNGHMHYLGAYDDATSSGYCKVPKCATGEILGLIQKVYFAAQGAMNDEK